jgi:hypothetical protein
MIHSYDLSTVTGPTLQFLELEAMVAWPRNDDARERFLCTVSGTQAELAAHNLKNAPDEPTARLAEEWAAAWEGMFQRAGGRLTLLTMAQGATAIGEEFRRAYHKAWLAGHVLGMALRIAQDPRAKSRASINLAKKIVHSDLRRALPSVGSMPGSHAPVAEAWSSHRCVAPWSLAFQHNRVPRGGVGGVPRTTPVPKFVIRQEVAIIQRCAGALAELAATVIPHGRRKPILPRSELLPAPFGASRPGDVTFHPLSAEILALITRP